MGNPVITIERVNNGYIITPTLGSWPRQFVAHTPDHALDQIRVFLEELEDHAAALAAKEKAKENA